MEEFNIVDKKSVNNEVLSNVLRGLLYSVPEEEIADSVDQFFNDDDVYEARKILVKHFYHLFDGEEPNGRHMGPKEREIKKEINMKDIVDKMGKIARMDHDVEFCIPWNYSYIVVSDEERRFREMVRQKDVEIDSKFSALENVIDQKNKEMIQVMEKMIKSLGTLEGDGEVYIHTPDNDDAANLKGAARGCSPGVCGHIYQAKNFDVQILNGLIVFCLAGFIVRLAQMFLAKFSIKFD